MCTVVAGLNDDVWTREREISVSFHHCTESAVRTSQPEHRIGVSLVVVEVMVVDVVENRLCTC